MNAVTENPWIADEAAEAAAQGETAAETKPGKIKI